LTTIIPARAISISRAGGLQPPETKKIAPGPGHLETLIKKFRGTNGSKKNRFRDEPKQEANLLPFQGSAIETSVSANMLNAA
jgi:hypothetical protein